MPPLDVHEIEMSEYLEKLTLLSTALSTQVRKAQEGELPGGITGKEVKVGDWVLVKAAKHTWLEPRWTGPYEVDELRTHAVRVKGKSGAPWHHLTHCTPASPSSSIERTLMNIPSNLAQNATHIPASEGGGDPGISSPEDAPTTQGLILDVE